MYRWNGWGDDQTDMPLPEGAAAMLSELVGTAVPGPTCAKDQILSNVPESRLRQPISIVSTDPDDRLRHAYGQSFPDWIGFRFGTISRFPDGVAYPATPDEITEILEYAQRENVVVIPFGGGTSVVGHLNVPDSEHPVISLSLERLNRLIDINPYNRLATFEAGVRGPYLEAQLQTHGYTLGHYPQSFEQSTLGGWVTTRSSGQQSLYYGRIEDLFAGGRLITPKGDMNFPPFPASAAGPDIRQILMGSEGRMGVVADAQVRITEIPESDDVYGVFFPSWDKAVNAVRALTAAGLPLSMVRLSNPIETMTNLILAGHEKQIALLKHYLRLRGLFDNTYCMTLIGLIGTRRNAHLGWRNARDVIKSYGGVALGKSMGNAWKKNRFLAPYLRNTLWDRGYGVDTLETAVNWDNVRPTMAAIEAAISKALSGKNENVHVFSHLSHVYASGSSIYTTFVFRLADTAEENMARWQLLKTGASQAIIDAGGTISHQHGVGADHKPYLSAEKGEMGMELLNHIWSFTDPDKRMNPGKLS